MKAKKISRDFIVIELENDVCDILTEGFARIIDFLECYTGDSVKYDGECYDDLSIKRLNNISFPLIIKRLNKEIKGVK